SLVCCPSSLLCSVLFCCSALHADLLFFFFSSRRRHTRSKRDWSSDVCSSDLAAVDEIKWDGEHHRTDIAEAAAAGRIGLAEIYGAPEAPAAGGTGRAAGGASGATAGPAAAAPELPGWRHVYSGKVRDLYI